MTGTTTKTLTGLQVMRAVAALLVAVHHVLEASGAGAALAPRWLITAGAAGVDVFFVISGFIMMAVSFPAGRSPDGAWTFFRKRVARIYPFYWMVTAGMLVAWSIGVLNSMRPGNLDLDIIIRSFLLAPSNPLVIDVSWTLVHEMNFYLLFAVLLLARNPLASLIGVSALLLLQLAVSSCVPDVATSQFLGRPIMLEFCFGLALGYAYIKGQLTWRPHVLVAAAALGLMHAAPFFIAHDSTGGLNSGDRVWAWGLPAALLVAASVNWAAGRTRWDEAWQLMGDASYAIYLLHPIVVLLYARALGMFGDLPQVAHALLVMIAVLACAAVGVAAHVTLERPASKFARRLLLPNRTQRPAEPSQASV